LETTQGGPFAITPSPKIHRLCTLSLAAASLSLVPGISNAAAQAAPAGARLTFTKTLKGSTPEYKSLSIDAAGRATYDSHKLGDPSNSRDLQISAATTAQIFSLASSLHNFHSLELNTHHKVANLGLKTFTYEDGTETNKVQFNFSENRTAQQLVDLFENISNVEERIADLEYDMKYDHLDLPQALRQIQQGMDDHLFAETGLMVPTLEKISNDPRFMHLAQSRAQEIIERIHQGK